MINFQILDDVAIIKLNRPEKRNALNPQLISQLKNAIFDSESDNNIKTIIITGEGSAFCAGADLEYLNTIRGFSTIENQKDSENLANLFKAVYFCSKPTIAAVNGPAIAGGCGLATACDFVFANPDKSTFGYSEVKIGFVPAIVSIFLLKRASSSKTYQLLFSGDIIDAYKAKEIGIVDFISNNCLDEATKFAQKLNDNSKQSIQFIKAIKKFMDYSEINSSINFLLELNAISRSTEDFIKGLKTFLKK